MTRRCRAASRSSPRPSTGAIDTTTTRRHVTRTRQRLAIAGTAAALAAAVSLVGGAFRESGGSARAVPILHAAASEPLESGLANGNTTKLVAKRPRPSRSPGRRSELHPARPRLPAAGPRDGQPRLLHEVRRNAAPRARPRPRRRDDDERAGLALAGSTPLWTGTRTREASRGGSALHLSELRRARRCPRRARPLPRGIQRLRPDELAAAGPLGLRAHLLRARAPRPAAGGDARDGARARLGRRRARAKRLDADAAREARLVARSRRRRGATLPRRARDLPRLRLCTRAACARRGGDGAPRTRDRTRATCGGSAAASTVGRDARRPPRSSRPQASRTAAVRARRRHRATARRQRRAHRARDRAPRRRPRCPHEARTRACTAST